MRRTLLKSILLGLGAAAIAACNVNVNVGGTGGGDTGGNGTGTGTGTGSGGGGQIKKADKIDIVVGVDNSRSMADKQQVLALALADLVQSLTNPPCLDQNGVPAAQQPPSGIDACPAGYGREFHPIWDIHVGIISSSLGGHGSDACQVSETTTCGSGHPNTTNNDMGHLLARTDACSGNSVPTYENKGFLVWDPAQEAVPPGEQDSAMLTQRFKEMVLGVGQVGCGYESQFESWYRFLADPEPYQQLVIQNNEAVPEGLDQALLDQRAAFLRPDSLLAILMLSDEDDCSIKENGQFYLAAQQRQPNDGKKVFRMPRARHECETNPNDPCCKSCAQPQDNCPPDLDCQASPLLTDAEDDINLRCFDQKRRFGIDFLYPTDRYVQALTSTTITNRNGDLVPNPIFAGGERDASLVVVAGTVGVPWQDLARDPSDLKKGYKSAEELAQASNGATTWDVILGDPASYTPPLDPLMIPSMGPRSGTNPVLGAPLASPNNPLGNPINGNEYTAEGDLQYACVFDLPQPRDCSTGQVACDCQDPNNDSPLCAPDPNNNGARTLQVKAKAYPGTRQLSVLKGIGSQAVVTSICPSQITDPAQIDYAYRPVVRALVERVKGRLKP